MFIDSLIQSAPTLSTFLDLKKLRRNENQLLKGFKKYIFLSLKSVYPTTPTNTKTK